VSFNRARGGWKLSLVVVATMGVMPFLTLVGSSNAGATTIVESDCITMLGGGVSGGNSTSAAACERELTGTTFKIGGYNTGSTFTGHLELTKFGVTHNYDSTYSWGHHWLELTVGGLCGNGTVSTALWRHNSGSNYTNMGTARIHFTCAEPASTSGGTVQITIVAKGT
jgi:hypothetical protein